MLRGPSRWGWMQQGLNPGPFSSLLSLGSGPTRSGVATALMTSWTGQATPQHLQTTGMASPAPEPQAGSRAAPPALHLHPCLAAAEVAWAAWGWPVMSRWAPSGSLLSTRGWTSGQGDQVTLPALHLAGWRGASQPSLSLPICAGRDRMGFLSLGWRVGGKDSSSRGEPQGPDGSTGKAPSLEQC